MVSSETVWPRVLMEPVYGVRVPFQIHRACSMAGMWGRHRLVSEAALGRVHKAGWALVPKESKGFEVHAEQFSQRPLDI